MRIPPIVLLFVVLNFLLFPEIKAQQRSDHAVSQANLSLMSISSAASSSQTDDLLLDWTIGEILTSTLSHNTKHYTQGFNQPIIQVERPTTAIPSFELEASDLQIYPNPSSTILQIKLSDRLLNVIALELIDTHGNLLYRLNEDRRDSFIEIDVSPLPQGIYWLSVSKSDELGRQNYKIVKMNP